MARTTEPMTNSETRMTKEGQMTKSKGTLGTYELSVARTTRRFELPGSGPMDLCL